MNKPSRAKLTHGAAWRWLARLVRRVYFAMHAAEIAEESLRLQRESSKKTKRAGDFDISNPYLAGVKDGEAHIYREWSKSLHDQISSANAEVCQPEGAKKL